MVSVKTGIITQASPLLLSILRTPTALFLIFVHPAPADPCPCFDEAVAFISVALGMFLGKSWSLAGYSFFSQSVQAVQPVAVRLWTIPSRIVLGTIAVAVWRIVVKKAATTALIPLISCVSLLFGKTDANTADQINDRQKAVITGQTLARSIVYAGIGYLASIALPDLFVSLDML